MSRKPALFKTNYIGLHVDEKVDVNVRNVLRKLSFTASGFYEMAAKHYLQHLLAMGVLESSDITYEK